MKTLNGSAEMADGRFYKSHSFCKMKLEQMIDTDSVWRGGAVSQKQKKRKENFKADWINFPSVSFKAGQSDFFTARRTGL